MANKKVEKVEKKYTEIKLICGFKTFYRERSKSELEVSKSCNKCNKEFSEEEKVYSAINENGKREFICAKCSKE